MPAQLSCVGGAPLRLPSACHSACAVQGPPAPYITQVGVRTAGWACQQSMFWAAQAGAGCTRQQGVAKSLKPCAPRAGYRLEAAEVERLCASMDIGRTGWLAKSQLAASQIDWRALQARWPSSAPACGALARCAEGAKLPSMQAGLRVG